MYRSRFSMPVGALLAALLLAACGAATASPTPNAADESMPTSESTPAIADAGSPTPPPPTGAPASIPTAAPTATPTAIPTPEAITIDIADRFQVIRESYSPEPTMKTFSLEISPDGRIQLSAHYERDIAPRIRSVSLRDSCSICRRRRMSL